MNFHEIHHHLFDSAAANAGVDIVYASGTSYGHLSFMAVVISGRVFYSWLKDDLILETQLISYLYRTTYSIRLNLHDPSSVGRFEDFIYERLMENEL